MGRPMDDDPNPGLTAFEQGDWVGAACIFEQQWRHSPQDPVRARLALETRLLITGAEAQAVDFAIELAQSGQMTMELTRSVLKVISCVPLASALIERFWLSMARAMGQVQWVWVEFLAYLQAEHQWGDALVQCLHWLIHQPDSEQAKHHIEQLAASFSAETFQLSGLLPSLGFLDSGLDAKQLSNLIQNLLNQPKLIQLAGWLCELLIENHPDDHRGWALRGQIWLNLHEPSAAIDDLARALKLHPEHPSLLCKWALAMGQSSQAERGLSRLSDITHVQDVSSQQELWHSKAILHRQMGQYAQAESCLLQGLALGSQPPLEFELSELELLNGRYAAGFARRLRLRQTGGATPGLLLRGPVPPLGAAGSGSHGEPGPHLRVLSSQGIGDTFQFARFIPRLIDLGWRVSLQAPPGTSRVLQTLHPELKLDQAALAGSNGVAVTDLPALLAVSLANLPSMSPMPYLHADPQQRHDMALRLGPRRGLRVGLCWRGHRSLISQRSVALDEFTTLATPDIEWISLQHGPLNSDERHAARTMNLRHEGWGFDQIAAAMPLMDVVISVDTANVHLAGAMGVRTWALICAVPDWRWGDAGSISPWYPSMRLFRQPYGQSWQAVLKDVSAALTELRQDPSGSPRKLRLGDVRLWLEALGGDPMQALEVWCRNRIHIERPDQALRMCRAWLQRHPDDVTVARTWVVVAAEMSQSEPLLNCLSELKAHSQSHPLAVAPALLEVSAHLAHRRLTQQAVEAALFAVLSNPMELTHHLGLARQLVDMQNITFARRSADNALALKPGHPLAKVVLLQCHALASEFESVLAQIQGVLDALDAEASQEELVGCLRLKAFALSGVGRDEEAELTRREILQRQFTSLDAISLGCHLLQREAWAEGWRHWRMRDRWTEYAPLTMQAIESGAQLWEQPGIERLIGRHLLVTSENGHGDTLQFGRFLPWLVQQGVRVTLQATPDTHALLSQAQNVVPVCLPGPFTTDLGPYDWVIDAHWLPAVLEASPTPEGPWPPAQWLNAQNLRFARPPCPAPGVGAVRVGLAWRSQPVGPLMRTMPLAALVAADIPGVQWVSLQFQELTEEEETAAAQLHMIHPRWSFAEMALAMDDLDLIVSIDTSICHLAGALGHRCVVLLSQPADWRWGKHPSRSVWYTDSQLLRQHKPGVWSDPLRQLGQLISEMTPTLR